MHLMRAWLSCVCLCCWGNVPNPAAAGGGLSKTGGAHSADFDKKVHKPQSKSYGRIGANMQLIFTHILWIWILLSVHHNFLGSEGLQGTHIDALNPFSSKLMPLTLRGGLWTFLANLALCGARRWGCRTQAFRNASSFFLSDDRGHHRLPVAAYFRKPRPLCSRMFK